MPRLKEIFEAGVAGAERTSPHGPNGAGAFGHALLRYQLKPGFPVPARSTVLPVKLLNKACLFKPFAEATAGTAKGLPCDNASDRLGRINAGAANEACKHFALSA